MPRPGYKGDSAIQEQPGSPQITSDAYGLDTLVRTWKGRESDIKSRFDQLTKESTDTGMFLSRKSRRSQGAWWVLTAEFQGFLTGSVPDPVFRKGRYIGTATLSTDNAEDPSVQVEYRAEQVTATYFVQQTDAPTNAQYSGQLVSSITARPFNANPAIGNLNGRLLYTTKQITTSFEAERVVEGIWRVTEVHENQLRAKGDTDE